MSPKRRASAPGSRRPFGSRQNKFSHSSDHHSRAKSGEAFSKMPNNVRVVVGHHACAEAIKVNGNKIKAIWFTQDTHTAEIEKIRQAALRLKISILEKSKQQMDQIAHGHQNVAVFAPAVQDVDWNALKSLPESLVLVLDGLEDPHNLGAILRSSWLMGVSAVFVPSSRAVGLTPSACKVAAGGAEHVPVEESSNLEGTLKELREIGYWIYGLDAGDESNSENLWQTKLNEKAVIVVGGEDRGIRSALLKHCDNVVQIPQLDADASYNASVAAALAISEWRRERKTLTQKTVIK